MSTFHYRGGPGCTPPVDVRGPGDVEVEVSVLPPLSGAASIDVQESADTIDWVSHRVLPAMEQEGTVHLPEDPARGFVRLHLDSGEPDGPPRRIRFRIRRRAGEPGEGREGGAR